MKISKLFWSVLAVAALTVGFTSCNDKDESTDDPFNNNGSEEVTPGDDTTKDYYSVQDLLDMKTNGDLPDKGAGTEKAWVEGYIVGCYNFDNDPKWIIGADNAVTTNVIVADDAESTDTYAVIALKLGDWSSVLNLQANPGNYKKLVRVYGTIEKYCGVAGVVDITKVILDGVEQKLPGETDVEVNDNMTPSEAAAAATQLQSGATSSEQATIVGYVSSIATEYSETYDNISFYMSDNQDTAETFYCFRVKGGSTLAVGDKIKVTAYLTNYKGTTPETSAGGTYVVVE